MSKEKIFDASPKAEVRERLTEMGFKFGPRMVDKHKLLIGRLAKAHPELEEAICSVFDMSPDELTQYKELRYSNKVVQGSRVNYIKRTYRSRQEG